VHDIPRKASGRISLGAWESVHLFPDGGTTGTAAENDFWCCAETLNSPGLREIAFVPGRAKIQ